MPTAQEMRETLTHYADRLSAGDVEAIGRLYAENGTMEDPVGAPAAVGKDAVLAFYGRNAGAVTVEITGPICCGPNVALMPLLARFEPPGRPAQWLDAIDLVEFDESGLIRALKAYWNPEEMRDTPGLG